MTKIDNETAENLFEIAKDLGERLAHKYFSLDAEDITQTIMIEVIENWNYFSRLRGGNLEAAMYRKGDQYCAKELDYYTRSTGQWVYTPHLVKNLLSNAFFEVEPWLDAPKKEFEGAPLTVGGLSIAMWDLVTAIKRLNDRELAIIIERYRNGKDLTADADRSLHTRAIDKICRVLNRKTAEGRRKYEGPGSREVITNAEARYRTRSAYGS